MLIVEVPTGSGPSIRSAGAPLIHTIRSSVPSENRGKFRRNATILFAPSIGNAHGVYSSEPELDFDRVGEIEAAHPIPIALHGGSGMTDDQFHELIRLGCAKVNISTALKITYMKSNLTFLRGAEEADKWDPPSLFKAVSADVRALTVQLAGTFGSAGRA